MSHQPEPRSADPWVGSPPDAHAAEPEHAPQHSFRLRWSALRYLGEPALWLALVAGLLWLATALDAVLHVGDKDLEIPDGITVRAGWSSVILVPVAGVALVAAHTEHSGAGRAWSAITGLAMIGTSFGWREIPGLEWLAVTSIVIGAVCLVVALVRPAWQRPDDDPARPWPVLLTALVVTPLIAVGMLGVQGGFLEGLVSREPGTDGGWEHLILGLCELLLGIAVMIGLLQSRVGAAVGAMLLAAGVVIAAIFDSAGAVGGVISLGEPITEEPPDLLAFGFVAYAIVLAGLAGLCWFLLAQPEHRPDDEEG